uniref:Uncharacterized protein n=1 Tax=Medicago truncatula TaxID=3880 RepID=A2Q2U4_MEDTR|nr:hypothetical protein MtrDRAFT_AC152184g37v2 [Medicago truncatula]
MMGRVKYLKAFEIAQQIEVPASSLAREDVTADAQKVIKLAEDVQKFAIIEAENLLLMTFEGAEGEKTDEPEAVNPEASRGRF